MPRPVDYLDVAIRTLRDDFVARYPYFFLVGDALLERPERARKTDVFEIVDSNLDKTGATRTADADELAGRQAATLVLAVRKVQDQFPSMITVGRTSNNDLVIPDINISRFHAFFRSHPDRVELADAGSANGTSVNGKVLPPKGAATLLIPGDRIAFAHLQFAFVDAGAAWDHIRSQDLDL